MYIDLILEVPLKAQKAHSHGMGFCCLRTRAKLAWVSGRNNKRMPAKAGMSFLYFLGGGPKEQRAPHGGASYLLEINTSTSLLEIIGLPSEVELVDIRIFRHFSKINTLPAHSGRNLHL